MHHAPLIATITAAFVLALGFGFVAARLRVPPLVGYLLAGIVLGRFTPGLVTDAGLAAQLADVGVILLMFGVGLHFSFADLFKTRRVALPGALVQIAITTALGAGLAIVWGWKAGAGIVFGLCLSVASTVVLLQALEQRTALDSTEGHIAMGWLSHIGKIVIFALLARFVGTRFVPWLLMQVTRAGSRELFTLAVLAISLGIAYGSVRSCDCPVVPALTGRDCGRAVSNDGKPP